MKAIPRQMSETSKLYLWEDVYVSAGRTPHYIQNQGNEWSFAPELRFPLFGIFGHLRPLGEAPRAVNLWELDWRRMWGFLSEQYGKVPPAHSFEAWWTRSNVDRTGGWDRFMVPGPGCPTLEETARGVRRPCIIQQKVRLRQGAADEYLDWFSKKAKPAAVRIGWQPVKWLSALHSSFVVTMFAAPDWSRVLDLASALPQPDPAWQADVETIALQAWAGSNFLKR
jgi:hypothetical protein